TELAKEGIRHLGYPEYFGNALVVFKILGTLSLMIPQVPGRIKEWAYAGFTFNFLFASISHFEVDGMNFQSFFPLIVLAVLVASYRSFHQLNPGK
ncbi:MAG TPA: DoxX family protein, partial [Cyclobacteriaceae bacterium]|nr:DoxX family protein [Cyclobacteriaceae bacterium]